MAGGFKEPKDSRDGQAGAVQSGSLHLTRAQATRFRLELALLVDRYSGSTTGQPARGKSAYYFLAGVAPAAQKDGTSRGGRTD